MTEMNRPYSHQAKLLSPGDRECRVCRRPVTGIGPVLRHVGEAIRPLIPAREDLPAFHAALEVVESALDSMWSDNVTDTDRARVAVEALYRQGALRTGRSRWRRPSLRNAA